VTVPVIAIDGPSGSGKSTVARRVAGELDWLYLDTGAMYRAAALFLTRRNIPCNDSAVTDAVLTDLALDFSQDGRILLNGEDVSLAIRLPDMSKAASDYSRLAAVRRRLTQLQRSIGQARPSVLEGRDIGTVVFPDAKYKFFLDATAEERARRRFLEMKEKGLAEGMTESDVLADLLERDRQDSSRTLAPLKQAPDAIRIDTTGMSIDEVVSVILSHL